MARNNDADKYIHVREEIDPKTGKKRYYTYYRYISPNGKKSKTRTKYCTTPKEAYIEGIMKSQEKKRNADVKPGTRTIKSTMTEFYDKLQKDTANIISTKNTTLINDKEKIRSVLNNHLSERIGSIKITEATSNDFCDIVVEADEKVVGTEKITVTTKEYKDCKVVNVETENFKDKMLAGRTIRGFKTILRKYVRWLSSKHYISSQLLRDIEYDLDHLKVNL